MTNQQFTQNAVNQNVVNQTMTDIHPANKVYDFKGLPGIIKGGNEKFMKKNTSLVFAAFVLALILSGSLACKSFTQSGTNTTTPGGNSNSSNTETANKTTEKTPADTTKVTKEPKIEKADFTMKAEDLDREFTKKGVKEKDLEKYANKIIAVTGRVNLLSLEKKGTTEPWVTLYAPGLGNGVSCYFDDDNVEQMKMLKMDKIVTVQGLQDELVVAEISPMLKHCVVINAD